MAFYKFDSYAHSLGYQNKYSVYLPDCINAKQEVNVVYLLHGLWGDMSDCEKYNLENYAEKYLLVLVYVNAHNSYYLNTKNGEKFEDYVGHEIEENLKSNFSFKIKDKSIIGISMGGYGAMRLGLKGDFKRIGNLSGSVILENRVKNVDDDRFYNLLDEVNDDMRVEKLFLNNENKIIYSYCGESDFLFEDNKQIFDLMKKHIKEYRISIDENGHTFETWNKELPKVLNYFFGKEDNELC